MKSECDGRGRRAVCRDVGETVGTSKHDQGGIQLTRSPYGELGGLATSAYSAAAARPQSEAMTRQLGRGGFTRRSDPLVELR